MNMPDLLRASRDVYVLTEKPNTEDGCSDRFWSMRIEGLHHDHIRGAVDELRSRWSRPIPKQIARSVKSVALQDSLARTLGAQSYIHWREVEQQKVADFLCEHGMSVPTDLIKWSYSPRMVGALVAQQVADRLFNSGLELPKRIFTGVGSSLFAPRSYGRLDFDQVAGRTFWTDQQRYAFCEQHEDKILMRAEYMQDGCGLDYLDMTGRMLMLNAVSEFIGCMYKKLGHDAESRHYAEGGTAANWPGYAKLIQRELIAGKGYRTPRPDTGASSDDFIPHRLGESCLMVSPLVSIADFFDFCARSNWGQARQEKALKTSSKEIDDLGTINMDPAELPVSLTWLDAVAYCRDYELRTGLPVRLMSIEEWQQISPPPMDFSHVSSVRSLVVKKGEMPDDPIYEQLGWGIVGGDGRLGGNSSHCHRPDGSLHYGPNLKWVDSDEGVPFLSVPGFGEWLSDYQHGAAPIVSVATGQSIVGGSIERNLCPVHMTMSYKGVKVGFRLCYVAHLDA